MSKEILDAVRELEVQKDIDAEVLLAALEVALAAAYRKTPEAKGKHARVVIQIGRRRRLRRGRPGRRGS